MTETIKKLHIWIGLFNFTILLVFAAAGLHATFLPAPDDREAPKPRVREVAYDPPGTMTDPEIAADLYEKLDLALVGPIPDWAIKRNQENVLVLRFHSPNGIHEVTLLEAEKKVRISFGRNSLGQFLNLMHARTLYRSQPDLRIRLWALYVDLSIFSLLFMAASGIWLWAASRPRIWWAWLAFATGALLFAGLWAVTR